MMYITFNDRIFQTRAEARQYLKSIGEGSYMKHKIKPIPKNVNDSSSARKRGFQYPKDDEVKKE